MNTDLRTILSLAVLACVSACGTPPVTDAGVTDAPVTDAPASDVPATDVPVVLDSAADVQTTDTGTGTDVVPTTDSGAAPSCASYCTSIMANCTGAVAQYSGMDNCLHACAGFTAGAASDTAGNTLGCRTYHAGAAAAMPAVHCVHAGPGGAGVCGMNCEGFCAIAQTVCTGANMTFATPAACMTACAGFTDTVAYNTSVSSGNSLACRLYHLNAAAANAAAATVHCGHIAATSATCHP